MTIRNLEKRFRSLIQLAKTGASKIDPSTSTSYSHNANGSSVTFISFVRKSADDPKVRQKTTIYIQAMKTYCANLGYEIKSAKVEQTRLMGYDGPATMIRITVKALKTPKV